LTFVPPSASGHSRLPKAISASRSKPLTRSKGLIVPVILRNPERYPPKLKSAFMFDFTAFDQSDSGISKPEQFFKDVRKIAEYAAHRYYELDEVLDGSQTIDFPDEKDALDFLASLDSSDSTREKPRKTAGKGSPKTTRTKGLKSAGKKARRNTRK